MDNENNSHFFILNSQFSTLNSQLIPPGYKQTEVGVIPEDWVVEPLSSVAAYTNGKAHEGCISDLGKYIVVNSKFISTNGEVRKYSDHRFSPASKGEILMVMSDVPNGRAIARCFFVDRDDLYTVNQRICALRPFQVDGRFLFYKLDRNPFYLAFDDGVKQTNLRKDDVLSCPLAFPPTKAEQEAIAEVLSDADALIESLEQLIAKKRQIKQGAMQELLRPKDGWVEKCIAEIADCLDNLRTPLNDSQRNKMKGDYPYCGANGILDYINNYCVDDSVILMAEDGGYFDEYMTRPIAYRMSGKFWVNNHAHILKSKVDFDQDFLFYSLVHKNILSFLANGTRAKLNKSELNKITIQLSEEKTEQTAIATILSDMDAEIAALEAKLVKTRQLKQGMMHVLLTGEVRLI